MLVVLALSAGGTVAARPDSAQRIRALEGLFEAARANDEPGMWAALSRVSRRRLGPTLADFRRRGARGVRSSVAPVAYGSQRTFVDVVVGRGLAVVAVKARNTGAVFAAPLRSEKSVWKVEIDPAFTIEPVRPLPQERVLRRTQLAAEVVAPRKIDDAAMWFDGLPFEARRYWSRDRERMSIWGEAPQPLADGRHTVVAFASAGSEASANAWTFRSYGS